MRKVSLKDFIGLFSFKPKPVSKRKGQRGQMAIFVALIFQVLFVFFAMVINIGLVVHDKINLQNAADLAAYYAAQRQAEWLNVIAHQNYQIRQSYKLFAWRYRVIGSMGLEGPDHPAKLGGLSPDTQDPYFTRPIACVAYKPGFLPAASDNLCKRRLPINEVLGLVPGIVVNNAVNFFLDLNAPFEAMVEATNQQIVDNCQSYGALNYLYANMIKLAYRLDQAQLKKAIRAQALNLARPANEVLDLNGDQIRQGVFQTVTKNLTFENRNTIDEITLFNSLENVPPDAWLNEIKVNMDAYYMDAATDTRGDCGGKGVQATVAPAEANTRQKVAAQMGMNFDSVAAMFAEPNAEANERFSLGFEKNPWVKVYAGVRIKTRPRQMFFPFGDPVQFEAVAYATPFGSRIGPWYKDRWPQGSPQSDGNKVDELAAPLISESEGDISPEQAVTLLPNYSRYPGDNLGLTSRMAHSAIAGVNNYTAIIQDLRDAVNKTPGQPLDPLTWRDAPEATNLRQYEIAAIAPDLFDISYYAIEPNYAENYLPKLRAIQSQIGYPSDGLPRPDLGGRDDIDTLRGFSVQDQLAFVGANSKPLGGGLVAPVPTLHKPGAYYFVKDRAHLLTSWTHNDVVAEYQTFPENRFMNCGTYDDEFIQKIPGSCVYGGGRTGYSVKIISGSTLRSNSLRYGGAGQTGGLLNPPPQSW